MRPLLVSILLLGATLSVFAQNGAKSVAARALKESPVSCGTDANTGTLCHKHYPTGCTLPESKGKFLPPDPSHKAGYDAYLNYFKNQVPKVLPKSQGMLQRSDFISSYKSAIKAGVTKAKHRTLSGAMLQLNEGQYFTVIGYLYYETLNSGGESSNCDVQVEPGDDYHIGVGFSETLAATAAAVNNDDSDPRFDPLQKESIIVEMTPHYRAKYHNGSWTEAKLRKALGYQVKVVGQFLLDSEHMGAAVCSDAKATSKCWRLSAWELHPVTEFYVCSKKDGCDANSTSDWTSLDDFQQ